MGLNSGEVIAGEIGSGALGYTAIGEQVGMAQRMESVAPPGAVMLSESTARLVEGAAVLAEPQLVRIKGAEEAVPARRLLSVAAQRAADRCPRIRRWWAASGNWPRWRRCWIGRLVAVGRWWAWSVSPGIGKTRLAR